MLSVSFATFFWLSLGYMFMKYSTDLPIYMDGIFTMVVILFMYMINVNIMQTNCGSSSPSTVFSATIFPWIGIFCPMIIALHFFPEWKTPFSNTFGYLIARLAGGQTALFELLQPAEGKSIQYVYDDPSLLLNQFNPRNFSEMLNSFQELSGSEEAVQKLYNIIKMKDLVSEWIWYMLTSSIVTTTSYSTLMRGECTKTSEEYVLSHNIAMANSNATEVKPKGTTYTVTE